MTIFHMSDIHIGEYKVAVEAFRNILDDTERKAKDVTSPLLLITGDLTSDGLREEYEGFHSAIDGIGIPHVIIPGNHDERNYGAAHFEEMFGERFKTYETEDAALFAADSAEPDNDAGHIGREHYDELRDYYFKAKDKVRIFALHHHLIAVPHTGREHNVVQDSGEVLGILDQTKCSLVLNGHRHVPWVWKLNSIVLHNAGTLLSRRIRGATTQTHTQIEITRDNITFKLLERDGVEKIFSKIAIDV
jgi:3',5'-cyclic AMP phosphodiesterase CpdA